LESLLEQLNSYLEVIGEALGENGQLLITGMPTEADVDAAEDHLKRGDSDFGETPSTVLDRLNRRSQHHSKARISTNR
jgi:hypothetical protein